MFVTSVPKRKVGRPSAEGGVGQFASRLYGRVPYMCCALGERSNGLAVTATLEEPVSNFEIIDVGRAQCGAPF